MDVDRARATGRASSEKASIRSTSRRTRSVSSTISWASGASSALAPGLQQLGRAADAGQRVLDLVRQHAAEAHDRAQAGRLRRRRARRPGPRFTVRVSSTEPSPSGRGRAVGLERRQAEEADLHAALADPGVLLDARGSSSETSAEPGGRAALNRPRASRPSPWPNSASAASLTATSAPSASTTMAGSGLRSKAAAFSAQDVDAQRLRQVRRSCGEPAAAVGPERGQAALDLGGRPPAGRARPRASRRRLGASAGQGACST